MVLASLKGVELPKYLIIQEKKITINCTQFQAWKLC